MLRHMLDATVRIRVPRDRPQGLRPWFDAEAAALGIPTISLTKLLRGAATSARPVENRREADGLAARLAVLSFDEAAADHAGDIRSVLERQGSLIQPYGILITGHARRRGVIVVTGNRAAFRRVDGLRPEDRSPAG